MAGNSESLYYPLWQWVGLSPEDGGLKSREGRCAVTTREVAQQTIQVEVSPR